MHPAKRAALFLALGWLTISAHSAAAVPITIANDGTDDILVTVYDMNTHPHSKLLDGQRINGFSSVPISVLAGAAGTGHVYWRAVTADPNRRRCGRQDKAGLSNGDSVHVFAHSRCPRVHR